ncbi:UBP-type zinc finger domain-containing protein [Microbacterium sp. NPDC091313]
MEGSIDVHAAPTGAGCSECERGGSWWLHLRRCAACGHIGCCELSVRNHAAAHYRATGHRYVQSYEPGESWWWDYVSQKDTTGPDLAPPTSRPLGQASPGPRARVPADWQAQLLAREELDAQAASPAPSASLRITESVNEPGSAL